MKKVIEYTLEHPMVVLVASWCLAWLPIFRGDQKLLVPVIGLIFYMGCFAYYFSHLVFVIEEPDDDPDAREPLPVVVDVNFDHRPHHKKVA